MAEYVLRVDDFCVCVLHGLYVTCCVSVCYIYSKNATCMVCTTYDAATVCCV